MFTLERQNEIVRYLRRHKTATVAELSQAFFIGPASIRRDLHKLEKQNLIQRTYGGAVLTEGLNDEIPLTVRESENAGKKNHIARIAAGYVENNDIIIIDSSTTSLQMSRYLKDKTNLTVVTNGLKTALVMGEGLHSKVYCCGGRLRENSLSLVGDQAKRFVTNYGVQKLFFSCRALTLEMGAIDASDEEAELRKVMINNADAVFLLCDSTKFDKKGFYHICGLDKIDCLVTDAPPSEAWQALCRQNGVELLY